MDAGHIHRIPLDVNLLTLGSSDIFTAKVCILERLRVSTLSLMLQPFTRSCAAVVS